MKYGLLGEKLSHSFSPLIHKQLGNQDYGLFSVPKEQLGAFMEMRDFSAINVTIPYKKSVIPFLAVISRRAAAIGSVIRDKEFSLLDVGIAVSHFTLQAADLGLGTCIIGWFNERRVRKALGIPRGKRIPLLITLGYPDSPTRRKSRKTAAQMSSRNRY